ncbi:molybdopterin-dependent oxidoreductase (plasmid) [Nocardioides sp. R1-1]|uniref:molybdopterin-containing oxidoreductase family protein n=1 Tax=Nocardioides sp. R1-1 TaxID=3383502 RepID=UPI0038CFAEA7
MESTDAKAHTTICRVCVNFCSLKVQTEDNRIVRIDGDTENPIYAGYRCAKGRNQRLAYENPARLHHPVKRQPDGAFRRLPMDDAIGEIADRVRGLVDEFGPDALAMYQGTYVLQEFPHGPVNDAFMHALGSEMVFSPFSLDSPGKILAKGLHGSWMATDRSLARPEVAVVIGANPIVSHQGRIDPPAQLLRDFAEWGTKLIVIDPRRTELARKADLHLQLRPGEDAALLAGMLRILLTEDLVDHDFLSRHVTGVEGLRRTVEPFTPEHAAKRSGVHAGMLVEAARMFGRATNAYVTSGVGPNMTGRGTLCEYLALCLTTICGQWSRAGDMVRHPATLLPWAFLEPVEQAIPPASMLTGRRLRTRDLPFSVVGPPAGGMAEEMLTDGGGRIRGLLNFGGSPATAFPDQLRMIEALKSLDLLVSVDISMSPTAKLADYVLPCRLPFELPATSLNGDFIGQFTNGWGYRRSYGQYTPAIVEPPEDSEVIPQWEVTYRLAQRLDLQLAVKPHGFADAAPPFALDMVNMPTSEEILEVTHRGSRIPLATVRQHEGGALYDDPPARVVPGDPSSGARLDVGNAEMLIALSNEFDRPLDDDPAYPFTLICRRVPHVMNTPGLGYPVNKPSHNFVQMHPDDLEQIGVVDGDLVEVRSSRATVRVVAASDATLRPGTVSMTHGFGGLPDEDDPLGTGANSGRLMDTAEVYDPFTGQPRMTGVPVAVAMTPE